MPTNIVTNAIDPIDLMQDFLPDFPASSPLRPTSRTGSAYSREQFTFSQPGFLLPLIYMNYSTTVGKVGIPPQFQQILR